MKVTATARGYIHGHVKEVGMQFEIPDEPKRKLKPGDDVITQKAAVKNEVPCAFASAWMAPGWVGEEEKRKPEIPPTPTPAARRAAAGTDKSPKASAAGDEEPI